MRKREAKINGFNGLDEDLEEPREEIFDWNMRSCEVLIRSWIHSVFA